MKLIEKIREHFDEGMIIGVVLLMCFMIGHAFVWWYGLVALVIIVLFAILCPEDP